MAKQRLISTLSLGATFFALGVIALGAFTRLMDAGLGCPDWPGCYGHLIAPGTFLVSYKAWAEMIHRYFAGSLGLLIIAIVICLFKKEYRKLGNLLLAGGLILLLAYQILLGQLTVTLKLLPIIVTQHLLGGFLILSILWLIYLNNKAANQSLLFTGISIELMGAVVALIILLLQITLGAWTSTNYASLSCPDVPFCVNNQSITMYFKQAFNIFSPIGINYEGGVLSEGVRQTIQMTHRIGALVFTTYMGILIVLIMPTLRRTPELMRSIYLIMGLLCIQLCIGMANVIFKLPLITALTHTIMAVLLLLAVITFAFKLAFIDRKVMSA